MKIKNTAPGGRGFTAGGKTVEIAGGATVDIPDAVVAAARQMPDRIVEGWFDDGTLVEVVAKAPAKAPAKAEPEAKPAK